MTTARIAGLFAMAERHAESGLPARACIEIGGRGMEHGNVDFVPFEFSG